MSTVTLINARAETFTGSADFVFTHPYAPIPKQLHGLPMIVNLFGDRYRHAEKWCGAPLVEIGRWGKKLRNHVYVANMPVRSVHIEHLVEDFFQPGRGWFPLDLPMALLGTYAQPGMTVWDGFCGRATIGRACMLLDMHYIGIDVDPERIEMAREYLGVYG